MTERSEENSISVIWTSKGFIISWTLIIVFMTLIVSLLWPKTYESESVIQVASLGYI